MLKDHLEANNVMYTEKLVDQDDAAKEEMLRDSQGFLGVPFTIVIKDDDSKHTVVGFDKNLLNSILGISA